jgi:two-component system, OmpR family, KDP operon response regulator KdpE
MSQGHILIVEDEPAVVYTLRCILENVGYTVSEASSGEQAAAALRARPADVILCDLGLSGGENGAEFLKRARTIQPDAGQVLLTGYAAQELIDSLEAQGIAVFMKPVEMGRLLPELRRIIEQKAA